MIKNRQYLSMPEVNEYLDKDEKEISGFIKKFTKLTPKEAKELRKKIEDLKIIKLKEEDVVKMIELLPESAVDLNKIINGLDENESKQILDTTKQFK